jgi:hypothetical protein
MSILHVNQIAGALRRLFDGHIDLSDAPVNPADREKCFLTGALAAFAVAQLAGSSLPKRRKLSLTAKTITALMRSTTTVPPRPCTSFKRNGTAMAMDRLSEQTS